MGEINVVEHVTLDGVMQAPGRPDEDERDGFAFGGWAAGRTDEVMGEFLAEGMASGAGLLLGRLTYEDLAASWAPQGDSNPMAAKINATPKFVVSRTLAGPLGWNATLLDGDGDGDTAGAVAELKRSTAGALTVLGSGELVRMLIEHRLVDRITLMIHPVVFGTGRRLFDDATVPATLRLVESRPTTTGVLIAVYEPTDERVDEPAREIQAG